MIFSIELSNYHHDLILEHSHHSKKKLIPISRHLSFLPHLPLHQPQVTTNLLYVSIDLTITDISRK